MEGLAVCEEQAVTVWGLYKSTVECYRELSEQIYHDDRVKQALLSPEESKRVEDLIRQRPCAVVLGEKNSGKSSLINQLLGGKRKSLPTKDVPCTSRLVHIKYSPDQYTRLLDKHGNERERRRGSKLSDIKKWIELDPDARHDHTEISLIVEVALNDLVLKNGLEIIDSPGFGENQELDRVIFSMLEKERLFPVFLYVIDANQGVRTADRRNIQFLREQCPDTTIIFVCNKIDVDMRALSMDNGELDDEGDDRGNTSRSRNTFTDREVSKMERVFDTLQREGLIQSASEDEDDVSHDMYSCKLFHGLSCRGARKARKQPGGEEGNIFLGMFKRFEDCIGDSLRRNLDKLKCQATTVLLCSYDRYLSFCEERRSGLSREVETSRRLLEEAKEAELKMFQLLTDFVKSAETHMKLGTVVQDSIAKVKPDIILDAETRELPDEFVYHEFDEPELKPLVKMIQSLTDAKSITAHAFCRDVCNVIINKVTNEVRREATALLKSEFSTSMKRVILTVYALELPALRRTFEKAYTSEIDLDEDRKSKKKETSRLLIQVATTLSAGIRRALQTHLNKVYSTGSICAMVNQLKKKMKTKNEQQWRTRIANELLSSLDATQLADSIRQACKGHLNEVHNGFTVSLEQLCVLNSELTKPHEQLKVKMGDVFVPMVADLKVRGYAVQYEIKYGKLKVGLKLCEGSRCRINECKAAGNWPRSPSKLAVKVVASEDKLGRKNESWNETMVTLHYIRSIKSHENLLSVYGWVIPRPGKLCIAVEKVKTDLQSLMEGASLELTSRIRMASNVASGLAALHKQGIMHGDLKPQNVLVKFDESSGWSALINTCKPKAIFAQTSLGEPFHIAPYLYEDSKRQRVFGDVYAFGMLLWFLCDGNCRRPDVYDKYTTRETMKIAVAEKAIRPKRPEECDSALWGLMKQCWMEEKRLTLDDILERLGI